MISARHTREFCKDDISEIENYDKAVSDMSSLWHCHHKAEIECGKTKQQLIDEGLYYDRPAAELVFLNQREHLSLHQSGERNNFFGHRHTEAAKASISRKMSRIMIGNTHGRGCKGKPFTESHKEGIRKSKTGCRRYTDGEKNFFVRPETAERLGLKKGWAKQGGGDA